MSMLNTCDSTPDDPVIDAAAERLVLKEMEQQKFPDVSTQGGFQHGYMVGFKEGVEFIRTFYRRREMLSKLREYERKNQPGADPVASLDDSDERRIKPAGLPEVKVLTWERPSYSTPLPCWVRELANRNILEISGNASEVMHVNTTKGHRILLLVGEVLVYVTDGVGEYILATNKPVTNARIASWKRLHLKPIGTTADSIEEQVKRSGMCAINKCGNPDDENPLPPGAEGIGG